MEHYNQQREIEQLIEDNNHLKGLIACADIAAKNRANSIDALKMESIGYRNQVDLLKQQILRLKKGEAKTVEPATPGFTFYPIR